VGTNRATGAPPAAPPPPPRAGIDGLPSAWLGRLEEADTIRNESEALVALAETH
jgi:hypothetical protein